MGTTKGVGAAAFLLLAGAAGAFAAQDPAPVDEERSGVLFAFDSEGKGIPGAKAVPVREGTPGAREPRYPLFVPGGPEPVAGGADGRIDMGKGRGPLKAWVGAPGRAWTLVESARPAKGDIQVRLHPGGSLRVTIHGWAAARDVDVHLEFADKSGWSLPRPATGDEVLLEGLPCETVTVTLTHGVAPKPRAAVLRVPVRAGEEMGFVADLRDRSADVAEVRVRVVADESGESLSDATLMWHQPKEGADSWSSESVDRNPLTELYVLRFPPGPLSLEARAPGRVNAVNRIGPKGPGGSWPTYKAGEKAEVTLRLVRAGAVRVLLRCDGAPYKGPGLEVWLNESAELEPHFRLGRSWMLDGTGGAYTLGEIEPGKRSLTIKDEGALFQVIPDRVVSIVADETAEVVIDLVRQSPRPKVEETRATFRIVDAETGEPVSGAEVAWLVKNRERNSWRHHPLPPGGKKGEYAYTGPSGAQLFRVNAKGYVPVEGGPMESGPGDSVEIPADGTLIHEYRLARAGGVLVIFRGGDADFKPESVMVSRRHSLDPVPWLAKGLEVEGNRARADDLAPGRYTIEVKPGADYESVDDTRVEVVAGKVAEVLVDLVRRK